MNIEQIIKENAGLIYKISKKFYEVSKDDLYQAGVLGIIKAYNNYQKDGDTKFSTYAYKYIYGEMYLVAYSKDIKLSKDVLKLLKAIERGKNELEQKLLRNPSKEELAEYLEMDVIKLDEILLYVNKFISMDDDNEESRNLHEVIYEENKISTDDKIMLNDSINNLNALEKDIINARYFEDLTQSETAKKLGITQVMVSRYETRSLRKMKDYMYM